MIVKERQVVILIDDDRLMHLSWSFYCKRRSIGFIGFKSISEFVASCESVSKSSFIFIDSNLENEIKGEIDSREIFDLGFFNLYLATGYDPDFIQKPSWIKKIFSKSPENIEHVLDIFQE